MKYEREEIVPSRRMDLKNKRKIEQKKNIFKSILAILFFLTGLVLLAISPVFNINKIEVYGNNHYKYSDIISVSDIVTGENWFKVVDGNLKDIFTFRSRVQEDAIKRYRPYIKNVTVRYVKLGVVRIEIQEREPSAVLPYLSSNILLDHEGYVIDVVNATGNKGFPVLKGIRLIKYDTGQKIEAEPAESIDAFYKIIALIKQLDKNSKYYFLKEVNLIDVSDINDIKLFVDGRILVKCGDIKTFDEYKITFIKEIISNRLKKDEKGVLDYSSKSNPVFIP